MESAPQPPHGAATGGRRRAAAPGKVAYLVPSLGGMAPGMAPFPCSSALGMPFSFVSTLLSSNSKLPSPLTLWQVKQPPLYRWVKAWLNM